MTRQVEVVPKTRSESVNVRGNGGRGISGLIEHSLCTAKTSNKRRSFGPSGHFHSVSDYHVLWYVMPRESLCVVARRKGTFRRYKVEFAGPNPSVHRAEAGARPKTSSHFLTPQHSMILHQHPPERDRGRGNTDLVALNEGPIAAALATFVVLPRSPGETREGDRSPGLPPPGGFVGAGVFTAPPAHRASSAGPSSSPASWSSEWTVSESTESEQQKQQTQCLKSKRESRY